MDRFPSWTLSKTHAFLSPLVSSLATSRRCRIKKHVTPSRCWIKKVCIHCNSCPVNCVLEYSETLCLTFIKVIKFNEDISIVSARIIFTLVLNVGHDMYSCCPVRMLRTASMSFFPTWLSRRVLHQHLRTSSRPLVL